MKRKKLRSDLRFQKRILERLGAWREAFEITENCVISYQHYPKNIESMFPDPEYAALHFAYVFLGFEIIKRIDCSNRSEDRSDTIIYHYKKDF